MAVVSEPALLKLEKLPRGSRVHECAPVIDEINDGEVLPGLRVTCPHQIADNCAALGGATLAV